MYDGFGFTRGTFHMLEISQLLKNCGSTQAEKYVLWLLCMQETVAHCVQNANYPFCRWRDMFFFSTATFVDGASDALSFVSCCSHTCISRSILAWAACGHNGHLKSLFPSWMVSTCRRKAHTCAKVLPHRGHVAGG